MEEDKAGKSLLEKGRNVVKLLKEAGEKKFSKAIDDAEEDLHKALDNLSNKLEAFLKK